jgi:hypothetical protein
MGAKNTRREEKELDQGRQVVQRRVALFRIQGIPKTEVQSKAIFLTALVDQRIEGEFWLCSWPPAGSSLYAYGVPH